MSVTRAVKAMFSGASPVRVPVAALVLAAAVGAGVSTAPAEARGRKCWETDSGRVVCRGRSYDTRSVDRRTEAEREYDRARANDVDPGGSYSAYPDWARYALSPKSNR